MERNGTLRPVRESAFLAPDLPARARICFAIEARSASDIAHRGGDVFEILTRSNASSTLLLADVSSKGPLSIEHTEVLRRRFRVAVGDEAGPARILATLNDIVFDSRPNSESVTFASAIVVTIDESSPMLTYSSAGHDIALLVREKAHRHLLPCGPVLGVIPSASFVDRIEPFDGDARLVVATDGFTECRTPSGQVQFGTTGIVKAVVSSPRSCCDSIARSVVQRADQFAGGFYHDDATLAVVARADRSGCVASPR